MGKHGNVYNACKKERVAVHWSLDIGRRLFLRRKSLRATDYLQGVEVVVSRREREIAIELDSLAQYRVAAAANFI